METTLRLAASRTSTMRGRPRGRRVLAAAMTALAAVLVSSCGGTPTSTTPTQITTQPPAASTTAPETTACAGTGGELIPITSDNVDAVGYDDATGVLTVVFESGGGYKYSGVPVDLWERFVAAQPNPWSAFGNPELVKGGYACARVS